MKRKNIILAMLPIILAIIVLQSCTKEDSATFTIYNAFITPTVVAPVDGTTLKLTPTTTTVDLKWVTTNADNAPVLADVYFGTTATAPLYKSSVGALLLNVPVVTGKTYYWYVVMKDTHGVMTTSPTWSFTIFDPLAIFVGNYNVDEPAEGWSYAVSFIKSSSTTIHIGNGAGSYDGWWASWGATFTLDLTANTYTMAKTDFGGGYQGQESGTINQTTGKMVGTYTVWQNNAVAETGTHTYTKK
jgi:hypothetical protein